MTAYYNENNKDAAAWLRNLIAAGEIAPGDVDERSIEDVRPTELAGYVQCHFFAGVGVWSHALRRAGIPDDYPVWTGSCPCQPFSAAGKGDGFADERHLWPAWFHLIGQCRPAAILGEQVASKDAQPWIDLVHTDLEALGYAFGAIPFPAAGIGAPHIRDRLYWVVHANGESGGRRGDNRSAEVFGAVSRAALERPAGLRATGVMEHAEGRGLGIVGSEVAEGDIRYLDIAGDALSILGNAGNAGLSQRVRFAGIPGGASGADQGQAAERTGVHLGGLADTFGGNAGEERKQLRGEQRLQPQDNGACCMADTECERQQRRQGVPAGRVDDREDAGRVEGNDGPVCVSEARIPRVEATGPVNGFWRVADWLHCRDERWRPVESGTFPLAHGLPASMGKLSPEQRRLASLAGLDAASLKRAKNHRVVSLRGYGNAIVADAAVAFIESVMT